MRKEELLEKTDLVELSTCVLCSFASKNAFKFEFIDFALWHFFVQQCYKIALSKAENSKMSNCNFNPRRQLYLEINFVGSTGMLQLKITCLLFAWFHIRDIKCFEYEAKKVL